MSYKRLLDSLDRKCEINTIHIIMFHIVNPITVVIKMSQGVHLGFAAEDQVGFQRDGSVVIKDKAHETLHKYELQIQEGDLYHKKWSYDLPFGLEDVSIRSASGNNVVLQVKNTGTLKFILYYKSIGSVWDRLHHEGIYLNCCLLDFEDVYAVERLDGEYEIVFTSNCTKVRMHPVAGRPTWKDPYLSVCVKEDQYEQYWMAVASANHTLDIYRRHSKLVQHVVYYAIVYYRLKSSFNGNHNVHHKSHYY